MSDLEITWVLPPSITDIDKHKDVSHNIEQNLEQQDTSRATPSSGLTELTVKRVENQDSESNSIVKQSGESRQKQSNIGKASYYQLYASKLKKKEGCKSGRRSRLETGCKTYKTGNERENTDLEDQLGMECMQAFNVFVIILVRFSSQTR